MPYMQVRLKPNVQRTKKKIDRRHKKPYYNR